MSTFTGKIEKNQISLKNVDLKEYEGENVMVIIYSNEKKIKRNIDLEKYVMPTTERAQNVDKYMSEMRDDDRI